MEIGYQLCTVSIYGTLYSLFLEVGFSSATAKFMTATIWRVCQRDPFPPPLQRLEPRPISRPWLFTHSAPMEARATWRRALR